MQSNISNIDIAIVICYFILVLAIGFYIARKTKTGEDLLITKRYRYTQPILFVERGVEFLIFPNGEFDFNTELVAGPFNDDFYYRNNRSRRSGINATFGAPGTTVRYTNVRRAPRGTLILHDRFGKVRRIGNVFINYDSRGRVKRVGSVYMRYRRGLLKQVGGLTIQYNRFGDMIGTNGFVNWANQDCNNGIGQFNDGWFDDDWNEDYDDDYYYYRRGDKKLKRKKIKHKRRDFDD